ncbi:MAG TPA: hypothetical protein VF445_11945 [Bordetella sp.]|uniref:hypothetical protein n=1 Tax=Bordetella sp. TaxID=28081 RepID=UPI002ED52A1A
MEPSDYFVLYVVLALFLAALIVAALIIIALRNETQGKIKPNNALKPAAKSEPGDRYQEKRAAVTALRADIDLALYTLELEGKTSVHQCQIAVQQVYQGWQKKHSGLFPSAQGKITVLGKKAGLWSYKLPSDLEGIVAKLAA